jgi:hypothetical protein
MFQASSRFSIAPCQTFETREVDFGSEGKKLLDFIVFLKKNSIGESGFFPQKNKSGGRRRAREKPHGFAPKAVKKNTFALQKKPAA